MATIKLITKPERAGSSKNQTRRERMEKRFASAKAVRDPYDQDYAEIERLCLPGKSVHTAGGQLKRRANTAKQDTAGIIAGRTLVHGMSTGLSSPSRPWFKLTTGDHDLDAYQPVMECLYDTEQ